MSCHLSIPIQIYISKRSCCCSFDFDGGEMEEIPLCLYFHSKICTIKRKMANFVLFTIFLQLCVSTNIAGLSNKCTVTLKNGTVNGFPASSLNASRRGCVYLSIPYASPPVGQLRFQAPVPAKPWTTPLKGSTHPNWCPQKGMPPKGVQMSEDCLYLNVHQPINWSLDSLFPVLVWFHGGSLDSGNSWLYNPARILSHGDIIYVSVHYRLGVLGFLSTGDHVVPGNLGLKDQSLSIRWIYENIAQFGGNAEKIFIFGQSAGGASIIFQFLSPLNKGLLSGVIAQSGAVLSYLPYPKSRIQAARSLGKELGCFSYDNQELVNCLRELPWQTIIAAQSKYYSAYGPVVEPPLPGSFISEDPEVLMRTGDIPDIPVIMGATKHDGSFILRRLYFSTLVPTNRQNNEVYLKEEAVPDLLKTYGLYEKGGARGITSSMEMTYLNCDYGDSGPSWEKIMPGLVDLITVLNLKSKIYSTASILSRRNRTVYLYSFEYHSNNHMWPSHFGKKPWPVEPGIAHGDDLMYLFNVPYLKLSQRDEAFSKLFSEMWLNFVKSGNPNQLSDNHGETWIPYNPSNEPYLKLNERPTMQYGYRNSWRPNGFQWD